MIIQYPLFEFNKNNPVLKVLEKMSLKYDWEKIEKEIEPIFKEAARKKHNKKRGEERGSGGEGGDIYPSFFPEECESKGKKGDRDEKSGRHGKPFTAYLRAFLYAPILHLEQSHEVIALHLETNLHYRVMCGFETSPARRTIADFDEIMTEEGLWERVRDIGYEINKGKGIIKEEKEGTINVDPTHLLACSTPDKYVKECRECRYYKGCEHKIKSDETAGWYQKSKWSGNHAHMVGMCQLGESGAPIERVILNGRNYEPDTLSPLLNKVKEKHPGLEVKKVNVDGIFNNSEVRSEVGETFPMARVYTPVNKGNKKIIENTVNRVWKIEPDGKVYCIAGKEMRYRGKDKKRKAFMYVCPLGGDAVCCEKKGICSEASTKGRFVRIKSNLLPKVDWEVPQPSFLFRMIYNLRTKIERLYSRMKVRFKFSALYQRGRKKVEAHIDKFMMVMHMVAFVNHSYGV